MPRVRVDAGKCVGHGRCYVLAPAVFEEDDRGHCVVIAEEISGALAEDARTGERNCPEGAITVEASCRRRTGDAGSSTRPRERPNGARGEP